MEKKLNLKSTDFCTFGDFQRSDIDAENRTLTVSFASEVPYKRWFGYEVIDVMSLDLERLNSKAPLLYNHDDDKYIGVVEKAWVDALTKKAYARVRFSKNELAEQIWSDIQDGIISNVSFKYTPSKKVTQESDIDEEESYRFFGVSASEVSFVTRPADYTVGLGRSEEEKSIEVTVIVNHIEEPEVDCIVEEVNNAEVIGEIMDGWDQEKEKDSNSENNKENLTEEEKSLAIKNEKNNNNNININNENKMDKELIKKMRELAKQFGQESLALEFIEAEKSFEEFQTELLIRSKTSHSAPANLANVNSSVEDGSSGEYVLGRAIKELAAQKVSKETEKLEESVMRKFGVKKTQDSKSVVLPIDELKRNVTVANPASAGRLVTEELDGSYLSSLSQNLVVGQLGARIVPVSGTGSYRVPVFGEVFDASDAYKPELALGEEFSLDVTDTVLTPKTLQIYARVSREIMQQSAYSIQTIVAAEMNKSILQAMNYNVIAGAGGAGKVQGILGTTGVETINVDEVNYFAIAQLRGILEDNLGMIDESSTKFLTNNSAAIKLGTTQMANALGFIYDVNTKRAAGSEVLTTGLIKPVTIATKQYDPLIYGDFSNLLIGMWGGLEISVNPYFYQNGDLSITATITYDSKVIRPNAFVVANLARG